MATIHRGRNGFALTDDACTCHLDNSCRVCAALAKFGPGVVFDGCATDPNHCLCLTHAVCAVGVDRVDMKHTLYYGARPSEQCRHADDFIYSPPATGRFHGKEFVRVVKVGLKHRDPLARHRVVYAGTPFKNLDGFRSSEFKFKADSKSNWGGLAHGKGCYVTPSFGMAAGYALWNSNGDCWKKVTLANGQEHGVAIVLMCRVDESKVKKCHGTAHSGASDGWDHSKIEWVAKHADVTIYNIIFCYWKI